MVQDLAGPVKNHYNRFYFLGASALYPVAALKQMLATYPFYSDSSLFHIPQGLALKPLTDSAARKHLRHVSVLPGLPRSLNFYDFHMGEASCAFHHGVPIQDIQAQGTWTSSCVWRYIVVLVLSLRFLLHLDLI